MMISNNKNLFGLLVLSLVLTSLIWLACDSMPSSVERNNIHDGDGITYVPNNPISLQISYQKFENPHLYWRQGSLYEDGYVVEKKIYDSWAEIAWLESTAERYTDNSGAYTAETAYRVAAHATRDGEMRKSYTNTVQVKAGYLSSLTAAPSPSENGQSKIYLRWQDACNIEKGFRVSRKLGDAGSYELVAQLSAGECTCWDSEDISDFQPRHYRVVAYGWDGTNEFGIDTLNTTFLPANSFAPDHLQITFQSEQDIEMNWEDICPFETGYELYYIDPVDGLEKCITLEADCESHSLHTDLHWGAHSAVKLRAVGTNGNSEYDWAYTGLKAERPALSILDDNGGAHPALQWVCNDTRVSAFRVERARGEEDEFVEIARLGASQKSYVDNSASVYDVAYRYRVRTLTSDVSSEVRLLYGGGYQRIRNWSGQNSGVSTAMALSEDGQRLATASKVENVKIWDLNGGDLLQELPDTEEALDLSFSSDNRYLLVSRYGEPTRVWDISNQLWHAEFGESGAAAAFTNDGSYVYTITAGGEVHQWETTAYSHVKQLRSGGYTSKDRDIVVTSDGRTAIATCSSYYLTGFALNAGLTVWRKQQEQHSQILKVGGNDAYVAACGFAKSTLLLDALYGNRICFLKGVQPSFHPDGTKVFTLSNNMVFIHSLYSYSLISGFCFSENEYTHNVYFHTEYTPDGQTFIIYEMDGNIGLWQEGGSKQWMAY